MTNALRVKQTNGLLTLLLCALLLLSPYSRAESDLQLMGVTIPRSLILPTTDVELLLNGYAAHKAWGSDAFVGALYTHSPESNPRMLLLRDQSTAMVYYFVRDDISGSMLQKLLLESVMVNNAHWDQNRINQRRIIELQAILDRSFNAGNTLAFVYSPETGLVVEINGKPIHRWTHAKPFFNILLRMWVGDHPPSRAFKHAVLNSGGKS